MAGHWCSSVLAVASLPGQALQRAASIRLVGTPRKPSKRPQPGVPGRSTAQRRPTTMGRWSVAATGSATSRSRPACREATVDRVLNGRPGVSARAVRAVEAAVLELERQQSQVRLSRRTLLVDVVVDAPHRFRDAVTAAVEEALPSARPATVRARFTTERRRRGRGDRRRRRHPGHRRPGQPRAGAQGARRPRRRRGRRDGPGNAASRPSRSSPTSAARTGWRTSGSTTPPRARRRPTCSPTCSVRPMARCSRR